MSESSSSAAIEARRRLLQKRLSSKGTASSAPPEMPERPADALIPASVGQQGMWYIHQMQARPIAYNVSNLVRIRGPLDAEAMRRSFAALVARHEPLRTRFVLQAGTLIQQITEAVPDIFTVEEIQPGEAEARIQALMHQPFDLSQAPLIRVTLLRDAPDSGHLLIVMHHIIADNWSLEAILWRDLSACYAAFCQDETPQLAPLTRQFADFALWQQQQTQSPAYQKQVDYWREQLQDAPPLLQLPTDHPRPSTQSFAGQVAYFELPQALVSRLQELSRESQTSLFMTMLAAYQLLLYRHTGQDDILVGTSVDMRKQSALENSLGYFLNTIVLRERFSEPLSFRQLLDRVRQQSLAGYANQDAEFEHVVRALNPVRDSSYNPIFQTMFLMWDAQMHPPALAGLQVEAINQKPQIAKFDLSAYIQTGEGRNFVALEYATDLFDAASIARLYRHFETLLGSILADPDAPVSRLNLLPDDERQTLLQDWIATTMDYPRDTLIHALIARHPADSIAIQDETGPLTYAELNQRANQIAHRLIAEGAVVDMPVGIIAERSQAMFAGILGILKAGAAYVPIDPDYPPERIAYMLQDAGISVVLTQAHLMARFAGMGPACISLDDASLASQPVTAPETSVEPQHLAYIIYTSGSTGLPKGVRVSHRNLVHSTTARFSVYPQPASRFLLLSSFAFDSSLAGIFWTLCQGGTLCLPSHQGERDVAEVARLIEGYQVTHMLALPSLYQILLEFAPAKRLQSLNTVIVAGEACPIPLVRDHYARLPGAQLYNEYGPTEGSVWCTVWPIPADAEAIRIGKPIPNMQVYLVDEQMQPVPLGVIGEILIGGEGIAQGYHQRPDLTAERFISSPFGPGRLYRTGDMGRWLPDGELLFLGRRDHQIKLSGYRIELSEIESVLQTHPALGEAVVMLDESRAQPQLAAFVSAESRLSSDEVRNYLQGHLPRYMLPAQIIILDALPQTPNGKLDRAALLAHLSTQNQAAEAETESVGPANEIETRLQSIWEEILGQPVPDTQISFFDMGGSSLQAIRLFARIQEAFDQNLPLSLILEAPSIVSLASNLVRRDSASRSLFTLQPEGSAPPLYLIQVNRFGLIHYQKLIELLGTSRPIYGLALPEDSIGSTKSLHQIAQEFAAMIQQQQPQGPYYLAGLSVAGVIAYEVASILHTETNQAAFPIMFDTYGPSYPEIVPITQAIPRNIGGLLKQFRMGDGAFRAFLLRDLVWQLRQRAGFFLHKRITRYQTRLGMTVQRDERDLLRDGGEEIREQLEAYFAESNASRISILLYRTQLQPLRAAFAWALHWDRYIPEENIAVEAVSGAHTQLLRPGNVEPITAHLQSWLAAQDGPALQD